MLAETSPPRACVSLSRFLEPLSPTYFSCPTCRRERLVGIKDRRIRSSGWPSSELLMVPELLLITWPIGLTGTMLPPTPAGFGGLFIIDYDARLVCRSR